MSNKIIKDEQKEIINVDDAPVFKYINPNSNDKLSKMSGPDLQDLIILIDDYYLKLRSQLGFDKYITFGLELEFENAMNDRIESELCRVLPNGDWTIKSDSSLHNGAEINSPVLRDTKNSWENLKKVCSVVEPLASIDINSGGHIHIGTQTLGKKRESWLNFIKLWSAYENIIFRFTYGEFLTARPSIQRYAEPTAKEFWQDYEYLKSENASLETIISELDCQRFQAVNFENVKRHKCNKFDIKNTIEFRCPNGTLDPAIWQNNVNLFVRLLCYSKNSAFDDDLVQKRHLLNLDEYKLTMYDEIYLEQALELCDMIFTNNFDKVYFLRQYLKSFQICKNNGKYSKAHLLTKKD